MKRKIDAMHEAFGTSPAFCKQCIHFQRNTQSRTWFKCLAYGDSASEATDWRSGYMACGLFNSPLAPGFVPMIERLKHAQRKTAYIPLEGQIEIGDILKTGE